MHRVPNITLLDYLSAPSYHWIHHPLLMGVLMVSALTILICGLAQLVHLSDMFQSWPWRYGSYIYGPTAREDRLKFPVAMLGVVLPLCWIWFSLSDSRYVIEARGILLNTTASPITATAGREKWTVLADGDCSITIYKWDVEPAPVLRVQGAAYPVPGKAAFVYVHGEKQVKVQTVIYWKGDRGPADLAAGLAKEQPTLSQEYQVLLALYKMRGLVPTPETDRIVQPGVTEIGRLEDHLFPPGASAPSKLKADSPGAYYEVRIER